VAASEVGVVKHLESEISNENLISDSAQSVLALLRTELGQAMSAVDIANMAGVDVKTVTNYRHQTGLSIGNSNSDSRNQPKKVKTKRGLRPARYQTKKQRERAA
jgi:hypothetical protein